MSEIVAIAYQDEGRAHEVLGAIKQLQASGALDLEHAMAVAKDREGRVKLEGATGFARAGGTGGFLLGALAGLVFFAPVFGPLIGVAGGAVFGAAGGALAGSFADVQQIDDFVKVVGDNTPPGSSAILMLERRDKSDTDRVRAELSRYGGTIIRTTLPADAEALLRAALGQPAAGAA